MAVASAALTDATAWILLAAILALAGGQPPLHLLLLIPYLLVMIAAVRPLLATALPRQTPAAAVTLLVSGLFLSAATTEWPGLHIVFGALLSAAILPRRTGPQLRRPDPTVPNISSERS